jgi:hypothetical protein
MVQIQGDSMAERVGGIFYSFADINIEQVSIVNPLRVDFFGLLTKSTVMSS